MKALLDANFLLIPGKFKVDIFSELQKFGGPDLYTLDLVIKELAEIVKLGGMDAKSAKLGLNLIKDRNVKVLKSEVKKTDNEIIRLSKMGFIACTQDRELIKNLSKLGVPAIYLRQKKYLVKI